MRPRVAAVTPVGEVVGRVVLRDLDIVETLAVWQDHVEDLTLGIQDVRTDELPLRLQHHTIVLLSQWTRLLRMIT